VITSHRQGTVDPPLKILLTLNGTLLTCQQRVLGSKNAETTYSERVAWRIGSKVILQALRRGTKQKSVTVRFVLWAMALYDWVLLGAAYHCRLKDRGSAHMLFDANKRPFEAAF
jgi:hypothetical protein